MSSITLKIGAQLYPVESFTFSGGEEHVSLKSLRPLDSILTKVPDLIQGPVDVIARLQSSRALVELLLVTEVLGRRLVGVRNLTLPYVPYARQDRVTVHDESFSLEAIGTLISNLSYRSIKAYDVHSAVTGSYLKNMQEVTQLEIIKEHAGLLEWARKNQPIILAPDKGALNRALAVAGLLGLPFMHADKVRDPATGKILRSEINALPFVKDQNVLIVDDICDGGATFIGVGQQLKAAGAREIALYVTHGIFSRGYSVFRGSIDRVYTTDTFIPATLPMPGELDVFVHKVIGA